MVGGGTVKTTEMLKSKFRSDISASPITICLSYEIVLFEDISSLYLYWWNIKLKWKNSKFKNIFNNVT